MSLPGRPTRPTVATLAAFRGWSALRHRNYRLFFTGQLVSLVGTWMQMVAQAWLVLQLTGDPLMLGAVAAAQFLPVVVLGLFGGVLADQLPKRQALLATQVAAMALAFTLFALTAAGLVEVWHILVLAGLLGMTSVVEAPTRQAFAVELVGKRELHNALGLNAASFNGARIVGPAVAGVTIGIVGVAAAFLLNGLSFLAVIVSLLLIRDEELTIGDAAPRPRGVRGVLDNLAEGLGYIRHTPAVLLAIVVLGLAATFAMNFQVLVPVLAQDVLGVGSSGFGFLMAASGVGSLAAALGVAFARRPSPRAIGWGALALGGASVVLAVSRVYPLSLGAMLVAGAGGIAMAVTANTTIQAAVPDRLRGRVVSVYVTIFSASVPAGGLLMGGVASVWGVPLALGLGGVVTIVVGAAALVALGRLPVVASAPTAGAASVGGAEPMGDRAGVRRR